MISPLEPFRWYHVFTAPNGKQWVSNGCFLASTDCQYVQEVLAAINEDIIGCDGSATVADGGYGLNHFVAPLEPTFPAILKSALDSRLVPSTDIAPIFRERAIVLRLTHGVTHQTLVSATVVQDFCSPELTFCISDMMTPHTRRNSDDIPMAALVDQDGNPVAFFAGCGEPQTEAGK
jgi:hypothetical protein